MNVELIAYTQWKHSGELKSTDPAGIVELAASVCYNSKPTCGFRISQSCAESGHMSVWEHISFLLHVSGVSRTLLAQLTRHRHAGFSVRSQRYCVEDQFEYVNPFSGKAASFDANAGETLSNSFDLDMQSAQDSYLRYIRQGVAPEDARMVLPNACCTELYISANARALIEMSHLRLCSRAQKEIRLLFLAMKSTINEVSPTVAELMVPNCEINRKYPFCPERKSCGRHPKLEEVYCAHLAEGAHPK